MTRPVLLGAGLGLLLLAVVAGLWLIAEQQPRLAVRQPSAAVVAPRPAASPGLVASAPIMPPRVAESGIASRQTPEQRQRLAQVRAEFEALRAQGAQASPAKMRALIDELQALSPPEIDPRYFDSLRQLLDSSAKVQALSDELKGSAAKNPARQQAIMAELKALSERVQVEARNMQAYAQTVPGVVKP